ncbi:MAG: ferredoxin family protein, partial [Promethearchaeota archaeon]
MTTKIEDKLGTLHYTTDKEAHIKVNIEACKDCEVKPCIRGCPAHCFELVENEVSFQYEDCIECGTCKILCDKKAIEW